MTSGKGVLFLDKWQLLFRAQNSIEAELIKGVLALAGIPTLVKGESIGALYGLSTGALAEVLVYVPHERLDEARALLAATGAALPGENGTGE